MPKRFSQKDRPEDGIQFASEHKGRFYGRFLSLPPAMTLRGSSKGKRVRVKADLAATPHQTMCGKEIGQMYDVRDFILLVGPTEHTGPQMRWIDSATANCRGLRSRSQN